MAPADASDDRIRVLIAAGVRVYRDALAALLASHAALLVVGTADTPAAAVEEARTGCPDVVVVDVTMSDGLALIRRLRGDVPGATVVAVAVEDTRALIRCSEAGAHAFVISNASADELVMAVERAPTGEVVCSPQVAAELFRSMGGPDERGRPGALTRRERQILSCVAHGLSNKEIGAALNIAEATVKNHVHHLLEKLHVGSRTEAAVRLASGARRWDVTPAPPRS